MEESRVVRSVINTESENDFVFAFCGYSQTDALHHFGPAVRPVYIIHIITGGKGTFMSENRSYNLKEGQGFLIEPDVLTYYQADREDPWAYAWIAFTGRQAPGIVKDMGIDKDHPVFSVKNSEKLKRTILRALLVEGNNIENEFMRTSKLYEFFSYLASDLTSLGSQQDTNPSNEYVLQAVSYIRQTYSRDIGVTDIASHIGITRNYLSTLFQSELGMSPYEYLTQFRLSRAQELLTITDLSVESIANSVGYINPLVFTKAFKRLNGYTPMQYRKLDRQADHGMNSRELKMDSSMATYLEDMEEMEDLGELANLEGLLEYHMQGGERND
ncbi:MAG: AraC family transcriptional regulator [Clostridiales Family XIII bacterium]|jgi:AraC family transcriptional regulator of arabinose operon|nr:AraC family transcriptional regulator [Clostridiales Family XIII bacterium]